MITATLAATLSATVAHADACCTIVELRQYEMKPGGRDVLIDMFDSVFVDAQEAAGNTIMGQFRDLDRPNRFVWLRGFKDMATRPKTLDAFYTGTTWQKHRNAANDTMIDVGDVLLLRPLRPLSIGIRPQDEAANGLVEITVYAFEPAVTLDAITATDGDLEATGAHASASYVTEKSANNYPRLPIRENENVLVRITAFPSIETYNAHRATLERASQWQALTQRLRANLKSEPQILRLTPTPRSLTHG